MSSTPAEDVNKAAAALRAALADAAHGLIERETLADSRGRITALSLTSGELVRRLRIRWP